MPWLRASGEASPTVDLSADLALPLCGAGAEQDRFKQRGLATEIGAHDGNATRARRSSAVVVESMSDPPKLAPGQRQISRNALRAWAAPLLRCLR